MYETFFQLEKAPFSMTPDPGFLFLTARHREALAGLLFAVTSRRGFVVLTGDAGTGKTTLLSRLVRSVPSERGHFSFVLNPTLTPSEFLELMLHDFGLEHIPSSKAQRLILFQRFLLAAREAGRAAVLVVDEAHKLPADVLEEIRLLSNFETAEEKLLQIVLAGQTELSPLLNREDMRQLKQRIAVRLRIDPLQQAEVEQYLNSRWVRAGGKTELPFTADAIAVIAQASKGIPRVVNGICDNALTNAFADGVRSIDAVRVREVLADLQIVASSAAVNGKNGSPAIKTAVPAPVVATPVNAAAAFQSLERYMPESPKPPRRWGLRFGGFGVKG